MNILLGALALALLLLPGLLFRLVYLSPTFSSRPLKNSFLDELLFSLVPAFVLQTAGYLLVDTWILNVREEVFVLLLLNSDKLGAETLTAYEVGLFGLYVVTICSIAAAMGLIVRRQSLRRQWHQKYSFLRIYTEWEIYFEGFILDDPRQEGIGRRKDILERWLDVAVESKDATLLYSGYLDKFVLTKDEKLDRIYLTAVRRRKLSADLKSIPDELPEGAAQEAEYSTDAQDTNPEAAETAATEFDDRYYFMPGHYFMIPGAEIRNINITFLLNEGTIAEEAAAA